MNLAEQINLFLGHAIEPRSSLGSLIPEWRNLPARETFGWTTWPVSGANTYRLRGCCFEEVSIALDSYRDIIFPDLTKVIDENGRWSGQLDSRCYQILPGNMLGEALETFVNYLSHPESGSLRIALRKVDWRISFDSTNHVSVKFTEGGIAFSSYFHATDHSLQIPNHGRTSWFGFDVFETIADLWADTTKNTKLIGSTVSKTTKAAGAPPPNGLQSKSKQAAKPASVHTEQLTHTRQSRQSRGSGLPSSSSTGKARRHEHEPDSDCPRLS